AWYVRDLILGRTKLPPAEERASHMRKWRNRFQELDGDADDVRFQGDYIRDLIEATDYPMFDIDKVVEIFLDWKKDKARNILTYRDKNHRSVMTGTMAATHHTPWLQELDDSLERYLSTPDDEGASTGTGGDAATPAAGSTTTATGVGAEKVVIPTEPSVNGVDGPTESATSLN
ncbi:MAG: NAD(P)/FAD-dependent oxidoreductase, partial [Actinomycetales bacterium]|nr:NAD(P)/FAD-dependent oxidoreductase [Actinomycetales bacterium]